MAGRNISAVAVVAQSEQDGGSAIDAESDSQHTFECQGSAGDKFARICGLSGQQCSQADHFQGQAVVNNMEAHLVCSSEVLCLSLAAVDGCLGSQCTLLSLQLVAWCLQPGVSSRRQWHPKVLHRLSQVPITPWTDGLVTVAARQAHCTAARISGLTLFSHAHHLLAATRRELCLLLQHGTSACC